METARWGESQENELAIWRRTVSDVADVLSEMAETASLVRFGKRHGLDAGATVAELGIGSMGIGWAAFAPVIRAVGIDPLPQLAIETGDSIVDRFAVDLQKRSEFLEADATSRLPFDDGSFDLVVCDNVIDQTQNPRALLVEGRRIVRLDGNLLLGVNVFSVFGRVKWRQVTRRLHSRSPNALCYIHSFRVGDLDTLLRSAGWQIVVADDPRGVWQRLAGHARRVRVIARPI